jgi:hypothetical protein
MHVGDGGFIGDGLALCLYVYHHLWDSGRGEADVHEGQVGKEVVHGLVQVGV